MKNGKPSVGSWGPACPAPPWQGAEAKKHKAPALVRLIPRVRTYYYVLRTPSSELRYDL
jgi:hypothetical protein